MNFDRNIAVLLLAPLIGLAVPVTLFFWKMPAIGLTPTETQLVGFSSQPIVVSRPGGPPLYSVAENPIRPPKPKLDTPSQTIAFPPGPIPTADSAKQPAVLNDAHQAPYVSMIYNDSGSKMAIIDGHVLREGSVFNGHTIVKIDKTRVLARTAGKELWLSIE